MKVREASFALRVVRRRAGDAGILYRRTLTDKGQERLTRIKPIRPLAFSCRRSRATHDQPHDHLCTNYL